MKQSKLFEVAEERQTLPTPARARWRKTTPAGRGAGSGRRANPRARSNVAGR